MSTGTERLRAAMQAALKELEHERAVLGVDPDFSIGLLKGPRMSQWNTEGRVPVWCFLSLDQAIECTRANLQAIERQLKRPASASRAKPSKGLKAPWE